ncbi:hypothetical protein Hamer_G013460 [Homarus americanus]|uniref:Uncharacterized protein n=1 Tax=Homarus americanus TaxID=6706 RepID=A0A8J5KDV9_HOMAM|nr:hypothetical protein Hamer_G013460 [Homarus americanus]
MRYGKRGTKMSFTTTHNSLSSACYGCLGLPKIFPKHSRSLDILYYTLSSLHTQLKPYLQQDSVAVLDPKKYLVKSLQLERPASSCNQGPSLVDAQGPKI